jgi:hypothetical protein
MLPVLVFSLSNETSLKFLCHGYPSQKKERYTEKHDPKKRKREKGWPCLKKYGGEIKERGSQSKQE